MRLLDLFCGAGGAAEGYRRAGFTEIVGVDIAPQPRYPFTFIQGDALNPPVNLEAFDLVHASPPCQAYSIANNIHGRGDHPDLIARTRDLVSGRASVIENVPRAPLHDWVQICGRTLGLDVKRHRWFEATFPLLVPPCPIPHSGDWVSVFGHTVLERGHVIGRAKGGGPRIKRRHLGVDRGRQAMGISWMNREELSEAIPPAYTEFIGSQFIEQRQRELAWKR